MTICNLANKPIKPSEIETYPLYNVDDHERLELSRTAPSENFIPLSAWIGDDFLRVLLETRESGINLPGNAVMILSNYPSYAPLAYATLRLCPSLLRFSRNKKPDQSAFWLRQTLEGIYQGKKADYQKERPEYIMPNPELGAFLVRLAWSLKQTTLRNINLIINEQAQACFKKKDFMNAAQLLPRGLDS